MLLRDKRTNESMATERLFTESDIQQLLDNNAAPPFGRRNAALIMGAVYWGLTSYELSMLSVKDVLAEDGEFLRIWVLPGHVAFNGTPKGVSHGRSCITVLRRVCWMAAYQGNRGIQYVCISRDFS